MKLRLSFALLLFSLTGLPLAAQEPPLFGNAVPLPWNTGPVHKELLAGKWKKARNLAQYEVSVIAGNFDTDPASVGTALALLAVAEAGAGDRDTALCHWNAAKTFNEKLNEADLSLYGKPGAFLQDAPQDEPKPSVDFSEALKKAEAEGKKSKVVRPQLLGRGRDPQYTPAARQAHVEGTVILESIIGENGRISNIRILRNLPKGLGIQALEAVCHWRFKAAQMDGKPVKIYYVLTINFTRPQPSESQNP
jgi:TonB family protein